MGPSVDNCSSFVIRMAYQQACLLVMDAFSISEGTALCPSATARWFRRMSNRSSQNLTLDTVLTNRAISYRIALINIAALCMSPAPKTNVTQQYTGTRISSSETQGATSRQRSQVHMRRKRTDIIELRRTLFKDGAHPELIPFDTQKMHNLRRSLILNSWIAKATTFQRRYQVLAVIATSHTSSQAGGKTVKLARAGSLQHRTGQI